VCWHVGSPVLGGNPLYRVSKWRTFVGKVPLQILSFRVKIRCVPRKILVEQVATRFFKGTVLQGLFFSRGCHGIFSFFT
jgi:hypothetical protein